MLIAKQMDVRSNIKKYFDLAYEGETVVIPRKESRNVVIISEDEYNRLRLAERIKAYGELIKKTLNKTSPTISTPGNVKKYNMEKLEVIRSLKDDWNGNGAEAFNSVFVDKVQELISGLIIQPEVFPTALGTIQLEFDNSRRDHMEIEIGESVDAEVFIVMFNGEEHIENIPADAENINTYVSQFYA